AVRKRYFGQWNTAYGQRPVHEIRSERALHRLARFDHDRRRRLRCRGTDHTQLAREPRHDRAWHQRVEHDDKEHHIEDSAAACDAGHYGDRGQYNRNCTAQSHDSDERRLTERVAEWRQTERHCNWSRNQREHECEAEPRKCRGGKTCGKREQSEHQRGYAEYRDRDREREYGIETGGFQSNFGDQSLRQCSSQPPRDAANDDLECRAEWKHPDASTVLDRAIQNERRERESEDDRDGVVESGFGFQQSADARLERSSAAAQGREYRGRIR